MLDVSEFLWKKFLKKSGNKERQINTQEQVTNKEMKEPTRTTYILEREEFCMFCLKNPTIQSSSNVRATQVIQTLQTRRLRKRYFKKPKVVCGAL